MCHLQFWHLSWNFKINENHSIIVNKSAIKATKATKKVKKKKLQKTAVDAIFRLFNKMWQLEEILENNSEMDWILLPLNVSEKMVSSSMVKYHFTIEYFRWTTLIHFKETAALCSSIFCRFLSQFFN